MDLLEEIANEQHFEVTFVDVEEMSKRGLYQCMVQLSTVPVAVCFGNGLWLFDFLIVRMFQGKVKM